jgi:DNA-binding MarR family transcriptional regulator
LALESSDSTVGSETKITLGLLNAVEEDSTVTQRLVSKELGIALGLTNTYLKRCIKKGLIKVSQAPANRYAYYLTPKGFAEKSRLTAEYLSISFNFFREARNQCQEIFETCEANGWRLVLFCGCSDLTEIAIHCAKEYSVELTGIADINYQSDSFADLPVYGSMENLAEFDTIVITDVETPQKTFDAISKFAAPQIILAPSFLNISRNHPKLMR